MQIGGSGNNQAGFAAFLVAKLICAPGAIAGEDPTPALALTPPLGHHFGGMPSWLQPFVVLARPIITSTMFRRSVFVSCVMTWLHLDKHEARAPSRRFRRPRRRTRWAGSDQVRGNAVPSDGRGAW
jgi:hypothetical protein